MSKDILEREKKILRTVVAFEWGGCMGVGALGWGVIGREMDWGRIFTQTFSNTFFFKNHVNAFC